MGQELCDAGMSGSNTCYGPTTMPSGAVACSLTSCGDGVVQSPEQCDDGNSNAYDGCSNSCALVLCEVNGYVYLDINKNQYFDRISDMSISSIAVHLSGATQGRDTTTNSSGYYSFSGVNCMSNYTVSYSNTTNYGPDSAQYEDSTPTLSNQVIWIPSTTFQDSGTYISPNNNFGLIPWCSIQGYVYGDSNHNKLWDMSGDIIFTGIVVSLNNAMTTITNASGSYSFTGLNCSMDYLVSYSEYTPYTPDSAQYEQMTQQTNIMTINVAASSFHPLTDTISPYNNFGLVLAGANPSG